MKVLDVANPIVITVFPESSLKEAIDILSNNPTGRIVVLKEEKPIGMVSTRDVVASFSEYGTNIYDLKVKDIMSKDLITVSPNDDVNHVVRIMLMNNIGGIPVVDNNAIVGIFTEREVLKLIASSMFSGLVDSVMSSNVVSIGEESTILEAAKLMAMNNVRRLPVFSKNNKLIGIITAADIVKYLAKNKNIGKVLDAGTKNPITISRYYSILNAAKLMIEKRIGTLPVMENQKLVGIVTERDLMYAYINIV
ncbi:putative signal transduction protein with CBS domains [Sulfolobus islandicus Y.G.57.14]|jgi:Predicted transcriptional regulator, contains C-terminal CBS domains|uniref:CBS domain protein n=6 Tax=Saccharolobus islandicus TaxID=43080 RepID=M9U9X2_SACIS|nr:CBS domain-containing protein [Sulfolobus islandicus]ACP36678.1 CBS domain containing protein [Sulfolobus islandicus L.S.2.15]ACP46974.1 putative signal transduction protein with CBS domains [Sulfolobus islandicus Y.G.57.14]ADB88493.1 CBS domain containing protein [Sulfolobus islandicus L.D.8.5]ADX83858.1 putative signal transduction protein with CBS domains [Sulfolobus islandicus HVE10/4]ADX86412.1 putative signal transduction protein with CBS domains [Sulfolobus islandicus REY15A]